MLNGYIWYIKQKLKIYCLLFLQVVSTTKIECELMWKLYVKNLNVRWDYAAFTPCCNSKMTTHDILLYLNYVFLWQHYPRQSPHVLPELVITTCKLGMYHVTDVPRDRHQVHLGATSESDNMEMENVMCCHLGITGNYDHGVKAA